MFIHSINHRLALAKSQAADLHLTSIYHYSANGLCGLAEIKVHVVLRDPVLKFKEPKAVRWLSHVVAINAVKRSLPALLTSLERESSKRSNPTALGLAMLCRTYMYMFMPYVMLMSDVLSLLFHLFRPDPASRSLLD